MKRINSSARKALAGLFISVAALTASMAQTSNVQDEIVGTWLVVSSTSAGPDGRRVDNFGGNPKGIMMLDRNGHFSLQQMGDARRKFASNNRLAGTADENKAAVAGSLAFFGTYSIDPVAK